MKDNIYELIYLYFLKDEEALHRLISIYRPATASIIYQKGLAHKASHYLVDDYFLLADQVMTDCLVRLQPHRYQLFSAFYKQALRHRIIDYNRKFRNSQIEYHYSTVHLDQYIHEDVQHYAYQQIEDPKMNIHQDVLDTIYYKELITQLPNTFTSFEISIWKQRMMGYSTREIADERKISIRKVRYILGKVKKWMELH